MRQLTIAVLIAALISLAFRLAGSFHAGANDAPPPKREPIKTMEPTDPIYPAVCRADAPAREPKLIRDYSSGPDRTPRGDEASADSGAVPRSTAQGSGIRGQGSGVRNQKAASDR
jgi:hypothetical protein